MRLTISLEDCGQSKSSAAAVRPTTSRVAVGGSSIFEALGFARMACGVPRAIEDRSGLGRDSLERRHRQDVLTVRRARIDAERLFAYRHRLATRERMPVVVFDLAPRSAIDDRLIAIEAGTLLAFERAHRD